MGDYLERLGTIPACIPHPDSPDSGKTSLKGWLHGLNARANAKFKSSDDSFSQRDYEYAVSQPWGGLIKEIGADYALFSVRIRTYIDQNRSTDRCLKEDCRRQGGTVLEAQEGWQCSAKKTPPPPRFVVTPKKPEVSKIPDVASLPPWWAPSTPESGAPTPPSALLTPLKIGQPYPPASAEVLNQLNPLVLNTALQQTGDVRKGLQGKGVDLVLAIHTPGCNSSKAAEVLKRLPTLVADLKKKGAGQVRIGFVLFDHQGRIDKPIPLIPWNDQRNDRNPAQPDLSSLQKDCVLRDRCVPLAGEATFRGLRLFDSRKNLKQVVVITDADSLKESPEHRSISEAVREAKKKGIKLNLINPY